jgi:hypothetical protein
MIAIPVRSRPWSKHYTLAAINRGFIRETKITEQWYLMISPQYLLVDFGLIGRKPFLITFFFGTIVIRV